MNLSRAVTTTFASLVLAVTLGTACGDDERWLGADGRLDGGGAAGTPGEPDAAQGGAPSAGAGGSSGDASAEDGAEDALADASDAADVAEDADASDGPGPVMPDFELVDENPGSALYKKLVSPRDYLGQVSAWYFGHAT